MKISKLSAITLINSILLFSCEKKQVMLTGRISATDTLEVDSREKKAAKNWIINDFLSNNELLNQEVERVFTEMSLHEKAAQLITLSDRVDKIYPDFDKLMDDGIAGGVLYLKLNEKRILEIVNKHDAFPNGKTKTLFMADAEPSLMRYKFLDYKEKIPNTIDIPADKIDDYTLKIDELLKKYHVKLNLGTVGDLGENEEVISNRAWGKTSREVISNTTMHIEVMQKDGIGATLKHFPGHGNIKGDSHNELVKINGELTELENFKSIMEQANPVAVLTGHIAIENNKKYGSALPATINPLIMKDLLRNSNDPELKSNSLDYKGLIITDAMNMKAVMNIPDVDFKALKAGNDIILIPKNPRSLHKRIKNILENRNHELHNQITESVKRVLKFKICADLIQ
ncbi:glycoside hydrolase family 3 N-terminal domain-containing protein [Chryseobacterium kwangjuense]|nr:glycoside hydrolase family 3 N-terminal domain-containing protein [Chryseobacterium kwangjuense]